MSNKLELIPPDSTRGLARREVAWKQAKPFFFAISLVTLLAIILAGLQQFFSFRGVVHTLASRIALGIVLLAGILFVYIATRPVSRKRNTWFLVLAITGIAFAWFLDWWAPKPELTNIAASVARDRPSDWRTIKDWQKAELIPILERYPNYTIHILASSISDEPLDYAKQFKEMFAAHKWKVIGPETVPGDQIALNMQLSISDVYWGKQGPEAFTALDSALQFVHIKTTRNFVVDPLARPDELVMWIGPQTPPDYPQHIPLQLGAVCRNPLQFTDDTMHFIGGDGKDFVRWVRIRPTSKDAKFVAGQRLFVFLTGAARSVAKSEYFKVQALGASMPRPDVLDITMTRDLRVGEQVDLKIISDAELKAKCVDNRL